MTGSVESTILCMVRSSWKKDSICHGVRRSESILCMVRSGRGWKKDRLDGKENEYEADL